MSISNFIPEIWSAQILTALRDSLVYSQAGMVNRDYEGEIARAGDTVHITSIVDVQVKEYTRNAGLTDNGSPISAIDYDTLSDSPLTVQITEEDYFAFGVDDIDRRQALPGFVEEAARSAAYGLAKKTDEFVAGLMANGVDAGNELGSVTVSDPEDAYDLLVDLRTKLVRSNTPDAGRWVVVPPELYAVLLKDDRFVRVDASGSTAGLRNGVVGRAAGFDVIEANVVPESDGVFTVLAGHAMATTFADQIVQTEALRLQTGFADAVRGLHVYGGLVVRPTLLASAEVEVSTSGS